MVDIKRVSLYVSGFLGNWKTSEIPTSPYFPNLLYSSGAFPDGVVRFYDITPEINPFITSSLLDPFDIFRNNVTTGIAPYQNTGCRIQIPFSRLYEVEIYIRPQAGYVSGTFTTATDLAFVFYVQAWYFSVFNLEDGEGDPVRVRVDGSISSDGSYFNGVNSNTYVKFQKYLYAGDYLEFEFGYQLKNNRDARGIPHATIILKELEDL